MARSSRSALRAFILSLPLNGEHRLSSGVLVHSHDGSDSMWQLPIVGVYRFGKKGAACVSDGFNRWSVNELTEDECASILSVL